MVLSTTVAICVELGARRMSNRLVCISNLQRIAAAFKVYGTNLPRFPFPSSSEAVRAMVEGGIMKREHTRSPHTAEELVIRYPFGNPFPVDNRTVVAYERLTDGLDGACVVFADGHGEYLPADEYRRTVEATEEATSPP